MFGILIYEICLAGFTWAWFSSTTTFAVNTITAAAFGVMVSIAELQALKAQLATYKTENGDKDMDTTKKESHGN